MPCSYQIELRRIRTELEQESKKAQKDYENACIRVKESDDPQWQRIKNYCLAVSVGLEKAGNIVNEPEERGVK